MNTIITLFRIKVRLDIEKEDQSWISFRPYLQQLFPTKICCRVKTKPERQKRYFAQSRNEQEDR